VRVRKNWIYYDVEITKNERESKRVKKRIRQIYKCAMKSGRRVARRGKEEQEEYTPLLSCGKWKEKAITQKGCKERPRLRGYVGVRKR
jgi:hypothetical protein